MMMLLLGRCIPKIVDKYTREIKTPVTAVNESTSKDGEEAKVKTGSIFALSVHYSMIIFLYL